MKRVAALGVLLSSAVALGFQSPPQSPPASPPPGKPAAIGRAAKPTPPVLEGAVKGPDGKPIAKALVLAQLSTPAFGEAPLATRTDDKGAFRLVLKSPTPHTLRVDAAGFAGQTLRQVRPGSRVSVALTRGGVVDGTVRDGAGQPVASAKVQARDEGAPMAAWEVETGVVEATSDARGRFRLDGLGRGTHTITATAKGYGRALKRSVTVGSRVDLYLFQGSSVSGTVIGPDGRGVKGAVVRAEPDVLFAREARRAVSDAAGRFDVLGLDRGTYRLTAHHAEFAPATLAGVYVEAGGVAQADLVLTPGSPVTGRLVNGEERPVRGRVGVQEVDGQPVTASLTDLLNTEAGDDGRFRIGRVPPGSHALVVNAPGFAPKRVEVEVSPRGGDVAIGDVVLEAGLAIRGQVRDRAGQGIPYAQITAFPARPMTAAVLRPAPAQSEADGSFVLAGVGPTSYRVTAQASSYGSATKTAEAGTDDLELVLDAAGTITGLVVDERDRPLDAFSVNVRPGRDAGTSGPGMVIMMPPRSDAILSPDGRFTLTDLAEGTWIVEATAPEHAKATVSGVKVAAGSTTDVGRIRLGAGGTVRGSVVNANGMPIVGATVDVQGASRDFSRRPGDGAAFTDTAGLFEVRGVPPGTVEVVARHPQYAEGRVSGLEVDPVKGATETRVVLSQGGRIEGVARRRDGRGIPGVPVQVMPARGGLAVFGPDPVSTGPDGTFVTEHVPPGQVMVTLMGRQGAGIYMSAQSKDVEVREGETTTVEFLSREILVSGRVTRGGEPAPGLRIRLMGQMNVVFATAGPTTAPAPAGPERMTAVTREDGSYELLVDEPGRFMVRIETVDGRLSYPTRPVEIPDAESHLLDFAFTTVPVAGVVVDTATEQPVPEARLYASPKNRDDASGPPASAVSGPDGRFLFELEPGEYQLRVSAPGYAAAENSLTVAGDVSDVRVSLSPGQEIAGRVVDARGQGVGRLFVSASGQEPSLSGGAMTEADGSFVLTGLARGTYTLFAWSDVAGYALRPGVAVGSQGVVLSLRPAGRVRVQVFGPDGAPVADVRPIVSSVAGARVRMTGMGFPPSTDAQGVVDIPTPLGTVEITAGRDRMIGKATVNVAEGVLANAEIQLSESRPAPPP